ncbi:MAG TPA: hypothetical protein VGH49_13485 [Xanthobacteraceae bacterium]|jgi:hypothetical protein
MTWRFAAWRIAALVVVTGGALSSASLAGEMRPEEARAFIAGKLFSYTCFDGTSGAGRIHADGSVIGTMQVNGGLTRHIALPVGTVRVTSDSVCASLPHALIQPCFNVVQTSPKSFRGSLRGLGFAYCDFVRRNPRLEFASGESQPRSIQSAIALRPSRY